MGNKNKLILILLISVLILFNTIEISSSQTPNLSDELIAYWDFEETSGPVIDKVNGLNNGVNNGATRGVTGIINNGFEFDGNDDYVNIPNPTNVCLDDNICSISLWVKYTNRGSSSIWFAGGNGAVLPNSITLTNCAFVRGALCIETRGPGGQSTLQTITSPFASNNNQWHHVIMTGDGTNLIVYIDGVQAVQAQAVNLPLSNPSAVENFAAGIYQGFWQGKMDEIGAWNRTLSANEVNILYNNGNGLSPLGPTLNQIGDKQVDENQNLNIQLQATNPLNQPLTYSTNAVSVLRSPFTFNSSTGFFSWTPNLFDSGEYEITFSVTDGQITDSETITITANDVSSATITASGTPAFGNTITLQLSDPTMPNEDYIFLTALGSSPGISLPGNFFVPLNPDFFFYSMWFFPFLFGFQDTIGTLDSQGQATVTWNIPPMPGFEGSNIYFAFVTKQQTPRELILGSVNQETFVTLLPQQNSLVAHWKFDEGAGSLVQDESPNNNIGTILNGAVWTRDSVSGYALNFDGADDKISIGAPQSITTITNEIELEAHIKRTEEQNGTIISRNGPFYMGIKDNKLAGAVFVDSGTEYQWTYVYGNTALQLERWYKVKTTYDGTQLNIYVDDLLEASTPLTGQIYAFNSQGAYIAWGEPGIDEYFVGIIDEVKILGR